MRITLYTANCRWRESNTMYPNKRVIEDEKGFREAVAYDHVCAQYKKGHRSIEDFVRADCAPFDYDNDHSDDPLDWITPEYIAEMLPDVSYIIAPSRNNGKPKGGKSARPRFHIYFPHEAITSSDDYKNLKEQVAGVLPHLDTNAMDAARFVFGCPTEEVIWHEGRQMITDFLSEKAFEEYDRESESISEGSRNSTMSHYAGKIIKRLGNTEEAHNGFLRRAEKCSPPLDDVELSAIWASAVRFGEKVSAQAGYVPPEDYNKPTDWEEPIPFDTQALPDFPVDALPESIGNYVSALAESTQTPVDMAATSALAILSVCMQGKYKIRAKADWVEPVNIYVLNVMEPSERKSAVANAMIRPLNVFEAEQNLRNAGSIEASKMQKRVLQRRQKALEEQAAKGTATAEDIQSIAEQIAAYREMKPLKLYVDDITTEKLTSVLGENDGKAAILSTEGGIFDTLAGAYSKNVNIDVMLKGYSGDSIRVDRIGRESESIMNPALTVLLMAQPNVVSGMMQNGTFRGRGLTARFLYSIPSSYVGQRKYRTTPVPEDFYHAYESQIRNLLEDECDGEIITLSPEADKMLEAFAEDLEPKLKEEYADIADWAGKLVGNILRISALLCRASTFISHDFLSVPKPLVVEGTTMADAIRIGRYFTEHAVGAFSLMGIDLLTERSRMVLTAIKKNGLVEFTRRDIMRLCRSFRTAEATQVVLDQLIDYGYIAENPAPPYSGKGRPKSPTYAVNPRLYS